MIAAFSSIALAGRCVEEVAATAGRLGYSGVELFCGNGGHVAEDMRNGRLHDVRRIMENHGVGIVDIAVGARLHADHPGATTAIVDQLRRCIEVAHELGAARVRTLADSEEPTPIAGGSADQAAEVLRAAAECTTASAVEILLSTAGAFKRAARACDVMVAANHPRVALSWCVVPPFESGEPLGVTWPSIRGRFRLVSVADAVSDPRMRTWPRMALGQGQLPLASVARLLHADGYDGPITVECGDRADLSMGGEDALTAGIVYLRRVFLS